MSDLYDRIESLCKKNGETITVMCRESGASRASLSDLKAGRKRSLSADTIKKISSHFRISTDYLLGRVDQYGLSPDDWSAMGAEFRKYRMMKGIVFDDAVEEDVVTKEELYGFEERGDPISLEQLEVSCSVIDTTIPALFPVWMDKLCPKDGSKNARTDKIIPFTGTTLPKGYREALRSDGEEELHGLSEKAIHTGMLYDAADDHARSIVDVALAPWEDKIQKYDRISLSEYLEKERASSSEEAGFDELKVYDEPAAAGLGNYLDVPVSEEQQYPRGVVPRGTSFGVLISGDSMEPKIHDRSTVFVKETSAIENGQIGIFVLDGNAYCKKLIVDHDRREVRLRSINDKYEDIMIGESNELRTIGRVLGSYPT